jgi:hypothetical protein
MGGGAFVRAWRPPEYSGSPHIFVAKLVHGQVYCSKRPPANLLPYQVLIDAVLGGAVILAVAVLGPRIERFLRSSDLNVYMHSTAGRAP